MKRLLIIIMAVMFMGCVSTGTSTYYPKTKTRYYNSEGRYEGYSIRTPYSTRYYGKDSKYKGYSR